MRGKVFACAILGGLLFLALLAAVASAADVSGTWSGTCTRTYSGSGPQTESAELSIDSTGDGTLTLAGRDYPVDGYVSGSTYTMHTQFGWDGVSMCDCDVDFTVSGDSMTGSGSFVNVGTTINLDFDLSRGAGFGLTITPAAATIGVIAVVTGLVGLDAAFMKPPVDRGARHGSSFMAPQHRQTSPTQYQGGRYNQPPSYQQGEVSETNPDYNPNQSPDVGTSVGGVGMTSPVLLDQDGNPFPPKRYDSQHPPPCPRHHIPCQAMFPFQNMNEPGSWFCPECAKNGNNYHDESRRYTGERWDGYPWGRYRP